MKIKTAEQFVTSPSTYAGAIVAGGYLRDLVFGKEPTDIDIFIPLTSPHEISKLYLNFGKDSVWGLTAFENEFPLEDDCEYVGGGFRSMRCAAYPRLNIILVPKKEFPKPEDLVANFTCSLSQIWMHPGSDKIHISKQFVSDFENNYISFRGDITDKYQKKIRSKYAERWEILYSTANWGRLSEEAL